MSNPVRKVTPSRTRRVLGRLFGDRAGVADPVKDDERAAKKAAKREAKAVKRDAKAASWAHLMLLSGKIDRKEPGEGTLLTEPVLVFVGGRHLEFRIFDQDAKKIGGATYYEDKATRSSGYRFFDQGDPSPFATIEVSGDRFSARAAYKIVGADGTEVATVDDLIRVLTATSRPVIAGNDTLGHLTLRSTLASPDAARLVDTAGSELARVSTSTRGCVAEIDPTAAGRLRVVAIAASIICIDAEPPDDGSRLITAT
jgi:hypothetical protein